MERYHEASRRLRESLADKPEIKELIRLATLAPNGHNTQPWRFSIGESAVRLLPDLTRRTPVVDPDDHHLYVSLGCAAETLSVAARAHGRSGATAFDNADDGRLDIDLAPGAAAVSDLYNAITQRQSTRSLYDGVDIPPGDLNKLDTAVSVDGVSVILITDRARCDALLDHVIEGNSTQMADPAFVQELRDWVRFNPSEAVRTGDGLFSVCAGGPAVPTWIGKTMFGLFFRKGAENRKYAKQMRSSAGVAIFVGDCQDKNHWVRVGRGFQRFALQATALGIRHAHVNQPVEVPSVRASLANWLGIGELRPDLIVRFGYAPPLPMSMRRPVDAVITADA